MKWREADLPVPEWVRERYPRLPPSVVMVTVEGTVRAGVDWGIPAVGSSTPGSAEEEQ